MSQESLTVGATSLVTKPSYDGLDQLSSVTDPRNLVTSYAVDRLGNRSQLSSPDTQGSSYTADEAGNVLTSTDARGKTTRFQYDPLNRLTSAQYDSGVPSQFEYDGGPGGPVGEIGNLTRMTDESGYTVFTHDLKGRVLTKTQVLSAGGTNAQVTLQYSYGTTGPATGKLESMTYPSGARVNYRFDANGRVSGVSLNQADGTSEVPLLTNITYTPSGAVQSWNWAASSLLAYQRTYDLDGRLTSYPTDLLGTMRTVSYNAAGMITAYSHIGGPNPAQYDTGFSYDTADRLTGFTLGGVTTTYVYDANGNRTGQTGPNVTYSYGVTSNRLNSATCDTPRMYAYDAGGNRTSDGYSSYTYSDRGRLAQVRGSAVLDMYYNALGQRVLKAGAIGQTYYVYDEGGHTVGEYSQDNVSTAETVYLGKLPIAVVKPQGYFYVLADHIDTPLVLAQPDGATVWDWRNRDPFGNNAPLVSPALQAYDHRFPGQIADSETGLFYNYFRDYDPQTGRYLQSDPIGLKGGINTYGYVDASPITKTDPKGLASQCRTGLDALGGAALGPLHHEYSCWTGRDGKQICRGFGRDPKSSIKDAIIGPVGGIILKNSENPSHGNSSCTPDDKNQCMDQCLAKAWGDLEKNTPSYGLINGLSCQDVNRNVVASCSRQCGVSDTSPRLTPPPELTGP
jgi:RHS repeat-associated protein